MINKKFGYALILLSFLFLWMHAIIISNALYRWIFALVVTDEAAVRHMLSTSPLVVIGGPINGSIFIPSAFVIEVLLLSIGVYVIKKNKVKV